MRLTAPVHSSVKSAEPFFQANIVEAARPSAEFVKHGRQFAWHVDDDAMTAARLHDFRFHPNRPCW
jgi:hypothetical protein